MFFEHFKGFDKDRRYRNRKYLDFIRKKPCVFCNQPPKSEAHHHLGVLPGGVAEKPSDLMAVPACRTHHEIAQRDYRLAEKMGVDIFKRIMEYLNEFFSEGMDGKRN